MEAYEFQTAVNDGIIRIPAEYRNKVSNRVKVILLSEKPTEQSKGPSDKAEPTFSAMKLDTRGFVFNREEANER
ncbi:MAG: hypothetical protein FWC62_09140 [Firmicutes bacterium]|nr:hypothetical protein [Bacillota bacterium]